MVIALRYLIWLLLCFSLISLVVGLVRPVYVLWFMDRMNRIKVIKIYGVAALVLSILYVCLKTLF